LANLTQDFVPMQLSFESASFSMPAKERET